MSEIASDLSRFHKIRNANRLDGPSFFMLANQLAYYDGAVMKAIARDMGEDSDFSTALKSTVPTSETQAVPLEQLRAIGPAAPDLGQYAGLFEIAEMK